MVDRFGKRVWPTEAVATFRGTWNAEGTDIEWALSNHLVPDQYITGGLCEPAVVDMPGGQLMMVMRGSSGTLQVMPSVKFFSISEDKGRTWGPAVPLTYPDASHVYSPGSLPNFFRSSKNGKVYVIANILPGPAMHCDPRYPLKIAEVDPTYYWVIPETETVIADREDRHPRFIRFSNWKRIEDRETGNPVIFMTEGRIDACIPDIEGSVVPDSYRYEIQLPE